MQSLLHQLENNEAILLMYLADELSAEDRGEVGQMLASDASMRAELDGLRAMQDETSAALGRLELHSRLPVSETIAVGHVTRMMRRWQIDRALAPPVHEPVNELRFPWWSYPLTTAAAVMIAFLVWWGNRPDTVEDNQIAYHADTPSGPTDLAGLTAEWAGDLLIESLDPSDEEFVNLALNGSVDAAIERLEATARRPHDVDAIFLNAIERNW